MNIDCQDGEIRLVGGPSESEGAVEVCFDHVWGNIAESGWSEKDASLICKLLNFLEEGKLNLIFIIVYSIFCTP